ncbi:MAG: hypothetical protein ACYTF6_08770, partial [Planctomycetota bacterium]
GGSWAWLEPCNAYLLDIETGANIRRVRGPYDTLEDWYLDGRTVYVEGTTEERKKWFALDLDNGTATEDVGRPEGRRLESFGGGPYSAHGGFFWFLDIFPENRSDRTGRHKIGQGRQIIIKRKDIEIEYVGHDGQKRKHLLCRLPRIWPNVCTVIVNDSRRLLFTPGSYLICVDMREFAEAAASTRPAAEKDSD